MKKKHFKVVNIAAIFIFIAAFFLNLQTGFNGSSGFLGIPAIAGGTGGSGGGGTGTGSGSGQAFWYKSKGDCSMTLSGGSNATVEKWGMSFKLGADGKLVVTFTDVQIDCYRNGEAQCSDYTCADFWKGMGN